MNSETKQDLQDRIKREKNSSDVDDVLTRSFELKGKFIHIMTCPSTAALTEDMDSEIEATNGLRVLDFGCGKGDSSFQFLQAGASVSGIDISQSYIDEAQEHARELGYDIDRCDFSVMDAHNLEFEDCEFDVVYGKGILHHLDLPVALSEINRVLKVGGKAVFLEPLAGNPLLKLLRWMTPKARTEDERPLSRTDLTRIEETWKTESTYYGLLCAPVAAATSILLRPYPNNIFVRAAYWVERHLPNARSLNSLNQYVLLRLIKKSLSDSTKTFNKGDEAA